MCDSLLLLSCVSAYLWTKLSIAVSLFKPVFDTVVFAFWSLCQLFLFFVFKFFFYLFNICTVNICTGVIIFKNRRNKKTTFSSDVLPGVAYLTVRPPFTDTLQQGLNGEMLVSLSWCEPLLDTSMFFLIWLWLLAPLKVC